MDVYGVSAAECFPVDDLLDFSNDQLFTTTDSASVQYYSENNYAAATGGGHCNANQYYSADFTHDLCVPVSTISLQSSVFVSVTGSCSITYRTGVALEFRRRLLHLFPVKLLGRKCQSPTRRVIPRQITQQTVESSSTYNIQPNLDFLARICRSDGRKVEVQAKRELAEFVGTNRRPPLAVAVGELGATVHALRVGEDAAVAGRAPGAEDAVQRVRRAVQVGAAGAGVQASGEPDVRADSALQLSPEGHGAAEAEGGGRRRGDSPATAAAPQPP
ncbi:hypothetical protein C3L33_22513, partial [Rhododendron williamsianum]